MAQSLIVVHVHAHVKPERSTRSARPSLDNARDSVREPGVARFDVVQSDGGPDALRAGRGLPHARRAGGAQGDGALRSAGATPSPMMAEPRTQREYVNVFPEDADW